MSHNTDAVVAGLSFLGQLDRIRDMPLAGSAPSSASAQPKPEPSLDARQPATLSERVKQAFAAHHLPIHNKKDIPFTTLKVACPGVHSLVIRLILCGLLATPCEPVRLSLEVNTAQSVRRGWCMVGEFQILIWDSVSSLCHRC